MVFQFRSTFWTHNGSVGVQVVRIGLHVCSESHKLAPLNLLRQLFNIACAIHLFAEHVGGPSTVSTLFRLGESYHNSELDDRYLDDANSCQ